LISVGPPGYSMLPTQYPAGFGPASAMAAPHARKANNPSMSALAAINLAIGNLRAMISAIQTINYLT
jgi:hypothetical protein